MTSTALASAFLARDLEIFFSCSSIAEILSLIRCMLGEEGLCILRAGFAKAKEVARDLNEVVKLSGTWMNTEPTKDPLLKVVAKRAPNLSDTLFKRKALALEQGGRHAPTVPCTPVGTKRGQGAPCQCCLVVSNSQTVTNNGHTVKTVGGCCKTNNIVYSATCTLCLANNVYAGKSVDALNVRVNGHRSSYYTTVRKYRANTSYLDTFLFDDLNVLGWHLVKHHNKMSPDDFNKYYKFDILAVSAPDRLRFTEQSCIDRLDCLTPLGLNQINSVGSLGSRARSYTM